MKPSHTTTPRNLAECTFDVGYPIDSPRAAESLRDIVLGYGLAVCIGFGLAAALVAWWSA
jgi:hypothetical protein